MGARRRRLRWPAAPASVRRCVVVLGRSGYVVSDGGAGDERHAHRPRLGDEPGDLRHPQSRPWVRTIKEIFFLDFSSAVFHLLFHWFIAYIWGLQNSLKAGSSFKLSREKSDYQIV